VKLFNKKSAQTTQETIKTQMNEQLAKEFSSFVAEMNEKIGRIDNLLQERYGELTKKIDETTIRARDIIERDQSFVNTSIDEMQTLLKEVRDQTAASGSKLADAIMALTEALSPGPKKRGPKKAKG